MKQNDKMKVIQERRMIMFNIIEMLFPIMFLLIFIMIIVAFVKGISTWHKNNNSPRLTVSATIVGKRQNTTHNNQPCLLYTSCNLFCAKKGYDTGNEYSPQSKQTIFNSTWNSNTHNFLQ